MAIVACIDDDQDFANDLRRVLQARSVALLHFINVDDFAKSEDLDSIDIILIDLAMADSEGVIWNYAGLEVLSSIRKMKLSAAPIYILTGLSNYTLADSSKANGAAGFFSKDNLEEVINQIEKIKREKSGEPLPPTQDGHL
jgi:FixJ family two-component response regulator